MKSTVDGGATRADADTRGRRITMILARAADTLGLINRRRDRFISNIRGTFVFAPQIAAAGTVMDPERARKRQFRRTMRQSRNVVMFVLVVVMFAFVPRTDWPSVLIVALPLALFSVLACVVTIRRWRSGLAAIYAAMPPPGSIVLADPAALTVNGIVIPWEQIVPDTVSLRWADPGFVRWKSSAYIDQVRLIAAGTPLTLDHGVITDGQELLDTICDKLDLNLHPAVLGDVNAKGLPLYPRPHPIAGWPPTGATMTTFDKREEGFEKKFAHDEELRFKANARRNKMLGLWAAEKLGLTGDAANAYAKDVVMADFEEAGDEDVFRKVRKDLDAKGVAPSDQEIRRTMSDLMEKAIAEIKATG